MVALLAPFWAIYVPGMFLGIFGFFLAPIFFDPNSRLCWMMASFAIGLVGTTMLLLNTLVLGPSRIVFPPIKSASVPIDEVKKVAWFWDPIEREAYMRFSLQSGEDIDIHSSRWKPKTIAKLEAALRQWSPRCELLVHSDDLEDLIAFRERFYRPKSLSLQPSRDTQTTESIDIPYHPHEQIAKFFHSLGVNEKYFWFCWLTVMLVPCILKLPAIIWGFIADLNHIERYWWNVPLFVRIIDQFNAGAWNFGVGSLAFAHGIYYSVTGNPFAICFLIGAAVLALVALAMFIFQPNGIKLRPQGLEIFFHWQKFVLFKALYRWKDMRAFELDQFGDGVNPEKWRMQIKISNGSTVNLKVQAIKGDEARKTLLRTISQMAPHAVQDAALIRALTPPQKESYTELWLQSLATPPKRNRLAPLAHGQKLKSGRYVVERQLASGGQGVAYVAEDGSACEGAFVATKAGKPPVVLKEFVLPVYTSRTVRQQALERFENEARILRDLDHPQIVKLIDYFLEDHRAYLVLEHIDGMSLRKLVQEQGLLSQEQILSLSMQMCTVLEYLHSLSPPVVHRDFTPENLILNRDGKLVLIDFNVAQQSQWTTTGTVVGKHAYLPPEQFRGKPSTQSDLYAMGATLFFLCTGKDPEPITCSKLPVDNPNNPTLHDFVVRLTALELDDRFQTITEVKEELEAVTKRKTQNDGRNGNGHDGEESGRDDEMNQTDAQEPHNENSTIIVADESDLKIADPIKQAVLANKRRK